MKIDQTIGLYEDLKTGCEVAYRIDAVQAYGPDGYMVEGEIVITPDCGIEIPCRTSIRISAASYLGRLMYRERTSSNANPDHVDEELARYGSSAADLLAGAVYQEIRRVAREAGFRRVLPEDANVKDGQWVVPSLEIEENRWRLGVA